MTQLEDLLRTALTDAPTPATSLADPLSDLDRRIGRAKLRIGGVAMVAVAALVAAIVVPVTLVGHSHRTPSPRPFTSSAPEFAKWHGLVDEVVSGGGAVWTLADDLTTPGGQYVVEKRNPTTGAVVRRYPVPTTAPDGMWFGAGQVWIANGGEDSTAHTIGLTALDPTTGDIANLAYGATGGLVTTMAFDGEQAWLGSGTTVASVQRSGAELTITKIGDAHDVLGLGVPMLAVPQGEPDELLLPGGQTIPIPGATTTYAPRTYHQGWLQFANAGGPAVWAAKGNGLDATSRTLVLEDFDASGARAIGTRIIESAPPVAVVVAPDGGMFAALDHSKFNSGVPIDYYSKTDLLADDPASRSTYEATSFSEMVANPAGGVIVLGEGGHVSQWNPAATTHLPQTPPSQPTTVGKASAVSSGGGFVWTMRPDYHRTHTTTGAFDEIVVRRDPDTLDPLQSYRVPGPADSMTFGLGRVWVWGGGDGGYPDAYLSVVRGDTGHVTTQQVGTGRPIGDIQFQAGSAWVLEELPTEVVRVTVAGDAVTFGSRVSAGLASRLAVGNGVVYGLSSPTTPSGPQNTTVTIDAATGTTTSAPHADGHITAVLPDGFLAVRDHRLVREDAQGNVIGAPFAGHVRYTNAAMSPRDGSVYVALDRTDCRAASCINLLVYSPSSLTNGAAAPTAATALPRLGALGSMTVDVTGVLDFVQGFSPGHLYRWIPPHVT